MPFLLKCGAARPDPGLERRIRAPGTRSNIAYSAVRRGPANVQQPTMSSSETEQNDEAGSVEPQPLAGTVAVVGFPNVGKSTLVNRLSESRAAVVHETSGVTRDRKEVIADWNGQRFRLIDTGGLDIADQTPIPRSIADQAQAAIAEADLILFVVDARAGITPGDEELAAILRRGGPPGVVLGEKKTTPHTEAPAFAF